MKWLTSSRLAAGTCRRDASSPTRAPWNQEEPKTCGNCSHCLEGCCDFGICGLEFEDAFDEADHEVKTTPWKAALWARDWIVEHYKDEQEEVCDRWDG